ncbi:GpE family phage tail protein, partial [Kingella kingae]|uniref:GpE family phage tail protein n=1 Tax=Kingella kingae TaxID=504 RepID=UPI001E558E0E
IWRHCKPPFAPKKKRFNAPSQQLFHKQLLAACADVAWWFGWSVQEIYDLPLDEFADWLDEVNRQIKAKYQKS